MLSHSRVFWYGPGRMLAWCYRGSMEMIIKFTPIPPLGAGESGLVTRANHRYLALPSYLPGSLQQSEVFFR